MLTISKPLSSGQAQTYHAKEFTSAEQNYWKQGDTILGEWHGKLAGKFGLVGPVGANEFARLTEGQHPHTTEQLVEGRDELSRVLDGVKLLPDDRREALIMRFALGMDNREIARALGRTDGATKVLLHRAIRQLEGIVATPEETQA